MTADKKEPPKKLSLSSGRLGLKKSSDSGTVSQPIATARKNTVQLEIKKKRDLSLNKGVPAAGLTARGLGGKPVEINLKKPAVEKPAEESPQRGRVLTEEEKERRTRVLEQAKQREQELRLQAEQERQRQEQERLEREAEEERLRLQEEERQKAMAALSQKPEQEDEDSAELVQGEDADEESVQDSALAPKPRVKSHAKSDDEGDEEIGRGKKPKDKRGKKGGAGVTHVKREKPEPPRKAAKISVNKALEEDEDRQRSLASLRRRRDKEKQKAQAALKQNTKVFREVIIPDSITVSELANRMAERSTDVIKELMKMGAVATQNQVIDADTAELIVTEMGHSFKRVSAADVEVGVAHFQDKESDLKTRPPVVTIMGHVDHGKTSLLDALRNSSVTNSEAGGITQHIGSYQIKTKNDQLVSFIDTPGHAAFSAMRARGADVTDIVILVVAADDSIMPQTIEALSHARAASVPIIIAINKIDKQGADPQKVKTDLLQHEIQVEDMGGSTQCVEISAKNKQGLDDLLEAILLQAEMLDLKANPNRAANGSVIEARVERGRGNVVTALIKGGTLTSGDIIVAGTAWGRVRALLDDRNKNVKKALPSMPVQILGLDSTPKAGDEIIVVENENRARELTSYRIQALKDSQAVQRPTTMDQLFSNIQGGKASELAIVIKSDVQGSIEAISGALEKLGNDEVKVRVLHSAVGPITESDVTLAQASKALIFGFNVRANPQARDAARSVGVDLRYYAVIYDLVDDVKQLLSGMLKPEMRENFLGYAEIREIFDITKVGKIAGCYITEGKVKRGSGVRLLRDNVVIHEGKLKTLRRFKDEVKEVTHGYECGMAFENYQDLKVGDQIECYEVEAIARTID